MPYTDAQKKATQKYKEKNYKRIPLDVQKEFYDYLKGVADSQNKSVNGFIKEAIDEKCNNAKDEIPADFIANLMSWLKDHGHSEEDIIDCIEYITK